MQSIFAKAAAASALALAAGSVQASIAFVDAPGGSELVLNLVDVNTQASYSLDLGVQGGDALGGFYAFDAGATNFVSSAGGLGNVDYAIVGGGGDSFTTSSPLDLTTFTAPAGAVKTTWDNMLRDLIGGLNAGDTSDVSVNNGYGPFENNGSPPNYPSTGGPLWQGTDSNFNNLWSSSETVDLWTVAFGSNPFQPATVSPLIAGVNLTDTGLQVVPVPAAVWLFGSALGLLGWVRRRVG